MRLVSTEVYPRVNGETDKDAICLETEVGLSPRERGNQCSPTTHPIQAGSIPA